MSKTNQWEYRSSRRRSGRTESPACLARAFDITGRRPEAIEYYGKLIGCGSAALGWEPHQEWIAAHMRLAEIRLDQGDRARAIDVLRPIVDLWREADPELPLTVRLRKLADAVMP